MKKAYITRKNLIALSITFIYCALLVIIAACVDSDNPLFSPKNPIHTLVVDSMGMTNINALYNAWIMVILFAIYAFLFACAFVYEAALAKFHTGKIWTGKYALIYLLTFIVCTLLWVGISMVCQFPPKTSSETFASNVNNSFIFLGESLLVTTIIACVLGLAIFSVCALVVNFHNIDKPYRFFKNGSDLFNAEEEKQAEEDKAREEQGDLDKILGTADEKAGAGIGGVGGEGAGSSGEVKLGSTPYVFPGLTTIDKEEMTSASVEFDDAGYQLKDIAELFRNYLAKTEKLYFDRRTIRSFLAGLAAARLIILEGLSGTGKSSLARYFSTFIGEESFFDPVQASWRDRTALLGYFNDFSKRYSETGFLKRLYRMTYQPDHVNIMVLDEVNIARVEYYFADFLSILEYPKDKWILSIMQLPVDFEAPNHLMNGELHIPENTWFIATANKDDSTYTITDKVYDRAITISFDDRNDPFEVDGDGLPIRLSFTRLTELYEDAKAVEENRMSAEDFKRFNVITDFVSDTFDITFGNRILNQIENFVPVYVALGGTKEEALDFLFSRKVISKLEGRFEDYIKEGLNNLLALLDRTYGASEFALTRREIGKFLRKL